MNRTEPSIAAPAAIVALHALCDDIALTPEEPALTRAGRPGRPSPERWQHTKQFLAAFDDAGWHGRLTLGLDPLMAKWLAVDATSESEMILLANAITRGPPEPRRRVPRLEPYLRDGVRRSENRPRVQRRAARSRGVAAPSRWAHPAGTPKRGRAGGPPGSHDPGRDPLPRALRAQDRTTVPDTARIAARRLRASAAELGPDRPPPARLPAHAHPEPDPTPALDPQLTEALKTRSRSRTVADYRDALKVERNTWLEWLNSHARPHTPPG